MRWRIEFSNEVLLWYQNLTPKGRASASKAFSRLENEGNLLRMPLSKSLGDGLYELRFTCEGTSRRVTYIFDHDRMVITLTTFRKHKNNEREQIARARKAQKDYNSQR